MSSVILIIYLWINLVILILLFVENLRSNEMDMKRKVTLKLIAKVLMLLSFGMFILLFQFIGEWYRGKKENKQG